jgi:hypothetical protein
MTDAAKRPPADGGGRRHDGGGFRREGRGKKL